MANKWDDEVEEAYAQLRESFASGKTRSMEWRKDQLQKFKTMMFEQRKFFEKEAINFAKSAEKFGKILGNDYVKLGNWDKGQKDLNPGGKWELL